ncbi:MAG: KamA family radical SAM protein [Deltaproteobacteria bacterium]|nr:KamA family radical SAM protein [Deltaproteobacteria bacterium]
MNFKKDTITSLEELSDYLHVPGMDMKALAQVARVYPVRVTGHFLSMADKSDPQDPLLRQVLPDPMELDDRGPLDHTGEESQQPVPGLIHRYPDRVLLLTTSNCFMHCRHCNRKRYWKGHVLSFDLERCERYIRERPLIREVIISGGDPLTLPVERLEQILARIRAIEHIRIVRIGSRSLTAMPAIFSSGLCDLLASFSPIWMNTHFNHPAEINEETREAAACLRRSGVILNNQAVLLRGINDNAEIITRLNTLLLEIGIRPYYLYHCDPVRGVLHFRTSVDRGIEIISSVRGKVSGLAQPFFAVDLPGGMGKVNLEPGAVIGRRDGRILLRTFQGKTCWYDDATE